MLSLSAAQNPFNLPTLLVGAVIAAVFAAIVIRGAIKRRRGEGGCGCGCSGCPNSGLCHKESKKQK